MYMHFVSTHDLKGSVVFPCSPWLSEIINSQWQTIHNIYSARLCFIFCIQFKLQFSHHRAKYSTPLVFQQGHHYMIAIKVIVAKASLIDELHKRPDSQVAKWAQQGGMAASSAAASAQISMEALWC